jgi:hypothetical protein
MANVSRTHLAGAVQPALTGRIVGGIVGGLVGGVIFGIVLAMVGMLPRIAGLVGSDNAVVGLIAHLVISAIIGAGFGLTLGIRATTLQQGAIWGGVYGVIWWILGPLLIMPVMMGIGPQFGIALTMPMMLSLVSHAVYGVATGLVYPTVARRFT